MKKIEHAQENLKKAVASLEKAIATPPVEDRDFAGIIQNFEFVYELTWKTLKKILEQEGIEAPFPRIVFEQAFKINLISDHMYWKQISEARNLSAHTYDQTLAEKLCVEIINTYAPIFKRTLALILTYQV